MILVTGGTGFIGQELIRQLNLAGYPVRTILRPSRSSPRLPVGVPVDVVVTGLNDERGLRAALVGVDTIYHLAAAETRGAYGSLREVDIEGTQRLVRLAADAGVQRIFYVSHLGADRASAFPVLKAKAIAEEAIRRSGIDFTILRSAVVFGPNDAFTTGLAWLIHAFPFFFLVPGDGSVLLQPLWIQDLIACLVWALEDDETRNQTYEIGGGEYLPFKKIVEIVLESIGKRQAILPIPAPYLRFLTVFLESSFPGIPISVYWLDYLAANRTCAIDALPRYFHLMPARFTPASLAYLYDVNWRKIFWDTIQSAWRSRRRKERQGV